MMSLKKLISFFISLVLVFGVCSISVSAETARRQLDVIEKRYYAGTDDEGITGAEAYSYQEIPYQAQLRQIMFEGFYNCQSTISILELGILATQENATMIQDFIYYQMPEAFHVNIERIWATENFLSDFEFSYTCTATEYQNMFNEFESVAQDMTRNLNKGNLTEVQKALILHDRLAIRCEYDLTFSGNCYNIYGALVEGSAVCQGYAEAYYYLLEKVGIKNILCSSDGLFHVWNIVYINGKSYHVDVTWDDPVFENEQGEFIQKPLDYIAHENFLLSTDALIANGHIAHDEETNEDYIDYNTEPNNTEYDTSPIWKDCHHETILIGSKLYHLNDDEKLCKYDSHNPLALDGIGDIDNDGTINGIDISRCRKHITGTQSLVGNELTASDIDGDGRVSVKDLVSLKRILTYM